MQELAGRLTSLDPEASESLKVISYFDALVANGVGADALVRAGAVLAGVPAGAQLGSRTVRVDAEGRRDNAQALAPNSSAAWLNTEASGGPRVWLEREGKPHANDPMILDRMSLALAIVEARRGGHQGAIEVVIDAARTIEERVAAAQRLRIEADRPLCVWAMPPSERAEGRTAVIAVREGLVRAVIADEVQPQQPAGWALAASIESLPEAWADARIALRLTDQQHPVVCATDYGLLFHLVHSADDGAALHPDVEALRNIDAHTLMVLDELSGADSVRAAASALGMHHSSLQSRHESWTRVLGYDPRSPLGRPRYAAARMLARLAP